MSTPAPAGSAFICRREVFDVLSAAGGVLSYTELRSRVEPRLRKYLTRDIENAGSLDAYLRPRLRRFTEPDRSAGIRSAMLEISGVDEAMEVRLRPEFRMPDKYVPGTAEAADLMQRLSQNIIELRLRRGKNDLFLPPRADRRPLKRSLRNLGWLHDQYVIADSTGVVIDGRVRAELAAEIGGIEPKRYRPVQVNGRGIPPAHGIVYAYYANEHRLSDKQKAVYKAEIEAELGIKWDRLVEAYGKSYAYVTRPPDSPISHLETREIPVRDRTVLVSGDREWVKLRDILKYSGIPEYDGKKVKNVLAEMGLETIQPNKDGSQATIWFRVSDMGYVSEHFPDDAWTKVPGRAEAFRFGIKQVLQAIEDAPRL